MDVLYLSSLCSLREYERMFNKYGSTSSHASQKFHRLFVQGLVENGCHVDALTQRILLNAGEDDLVRPDEVEDQVHYSYLPRCAHRSANRLTVICRTAARVLRWNREHPGGVIFCDVILGELSLGLCIASRLARLKTVAIVTDVPSIRAGERRRGLRAIPFKIKNAAIQAYSAYVFLTRQMNRALNPRGKPYVVVEGLADRAVLDEPNTLEHKFPEKVCMMAGLLEEIYGVDILLNAFRRVELPEARLWFYGRGSAVEAIREASRRDSRISYRGELANQEIVRLEKKAALLVNPRPPEGEWTAYSFPSKNMEYMASGTPLMAYDLSQDRMDLHLFGLEAQRWITANKNPKKQTEKVKKLMEQLER